MFINKKVISRSRHLEPFFFYIHSRHRIPLIVIVFNSFFFPFHFISSFFYLPLHFNILMSKITDQPPKRVKVTLACTICRKKKVKCDGIQPTCSRCRSIGICCQYSDPPKKRGPPKGYVEVIENRAHRIESILGTTNQQPLQQQIQQQLYPHSRMHINQYHHNSDTNTIISVNNDTTSGRLQTIKSYLYYIALNI